jgi:hypothetical protein
VRSSTATFDLVVVGTLDSQTLLSGHANLRLANYVYTVESACSCAGASPGRVCTSTSCCWGSGSRWSSAPRSCAWQAGAAVLLVGLPVFCASVCFSRLFARASNLGGAVGMNLVGAWPAGCANTLQC